MSSVLIRMASIRSNTNSGVNTKPSTFMFLDLPYELRVIVYYHAIDYKRPRDITALLYVNHQVQEETQAAMLRKYNFFHVDLYCGEDVLDELVFHLPNRTITKTGELAARTVGKFIPDSAWWSLELFGEHLRIRTGLKWHSLMVIGQQSLRRFLYALYIEEPGVLGWDSESWRRQRDRHRQGGWIHAGFLNLCHSPRGDLTSQQGLMEVLTDCCWGFSSVILSGVIDDVFKKVGERKMTGFRWSSFDEMVEELENFRARSRTFVEDDELDEAIMLYTIAQRMLTFFLDTGEIELNFHLIQVPERRRRCMQLRFDLGADLTAAYFDLVHKDSSRRLQHAKSIIVSANEALRNISTLWRPMPEDEACVLYAYGSAHKVLNRFGRARDSLQQALVLSPDDVVIRRELREVEGLLRVSKNREA